MKHRLSIIGIIILGLSLSANAQGYDHQDSQNGRWQDTPEARQKWDDHRENMKKLMESKTFDEALAKKIMAEGDNFRLDRMKEGHERYQKGERYNMNGRGYGAHPRKSRDGGHYNGGHGGGHGSNRGQMYGSGCGNYQY